MKFYGGQTARGSLVYVLAISVVAIGIYAGLGAIFGERAVREVSAQVVQQDPFLSRRIDQIDQRIYSIENRLNRLESAPRPTGVTSPTITGSNEAEIRMLQADVSSMRIRLGEAECGLLKLDERTLSNAARAARKKSIVGGTENCRLERDVPIALSARP